ncbi:MAG: hypothetical protein CR971_02485, partial [candidate division SR1 bacterium]
NDKVIDDEIGNKCDPNNGDEDDHDIAVIKVETPKVYDLALRKIVISKGPFRAGDEVRFNITVYNQGEVDAKNIEVVDYGLNPGQNGFLSCLLDKTKTKTKRREECKWEMDQIKFDLKDNSWTEKDKKYYKNIPFIGAGKSETISISFQIPHDLRGMTLKNVAEISKDDGEDCDSNPDTNKNNDKVIDDEIGNKCDPNNGDEDDHDIAVISVTQGTEKLEITKKLLGKKIYLPGEEVKFRIEVVNTGTLIAKNVVVKDSMPDSLRYRSSTIVSNHTGTLITGSTSFTYSGLTLKVGETFAFEVTGIVKANPNQNATTNCATVTSHNVGPACDKFGLQPKPELDKKQKIHNGGNGYTDSELTVKKGDVIDYEIVFKNTGSATAQTVSITDHLPNGLEYVNGSAELAPVTGTLSVVNNTIAFKGFAMKPGARVTMRLQAKVTTDELNVLVNKAVLNFDGTEIQDEVQVRPEKVKLSCDIDVADTSITIEEDESQEVKVTCKTKNGERADRIRIFCDNTRGDKYSDTNVKKISYVCKYSDEDKGSVYPRCEISDDNYDDVECSDRIKVKVDDAYGECGDGRRDSGEDCDWGGSSRKLTKNTKLFEHDRNNTNRKLKWFLDRNYDEDDYDNWEDYYDDYDEFKCTKGCRIKAKRKKDKKEDFIAAIPKCLTNDAPISVQKGEKMPIWWRLEKSGIDIVDESQCSKRKQEKAQDDYKTLISQDDLECKFTVYNTKDWDTPVLKFTREGKECYDSSRGNENYTKEDLYKFFFDTRTKKDGIAAKDKDGKITNKYDWHIQKANGKYIIDTDGFDEIDDNLGEYKLVLEEVRSQFCTPKGDWKKAQLYNRVCEVNFTVTEPYLIQKGLYGLFPTATSQGRNFFGKFYEMKDSNPLLQGSQFRKYLGSTTIVDGNDYKLNTTLKSKIENFEKKYKKLAVATNKTGVKKVPGKNIFFVTPDGNKPFTIEQKGQNDTYVASKYTIIVDGNVTVKGSITTNGMIIANKIKFEDKSDTAFRCEMGGQTVQGIFIAKNGFEGDSQFNTDENKERCNYGNLKVKGVLIGKDIKNLVDQKRSHLNGWFWVKSQKDKDVDNERRREIFEGASVLVEYNPYLWTDLPPGASDFINAVDIYKK